MIQSVVRQVARVTIVIAIGILSTAANNNGVSGKVAAGESAVAQSHLPEVRLRKLHLVRPDLIPYPIQYEVYC